MIGEFLDRAGIYCVGPVFCSYKYNKRTISQVSMKMTMSLLGLLRLHRFSRKLSKTDCRMDTRIQVLYTCFFVFSLVIQNISLARIRV